MFTYTQFLDIVCSEFPNHSHNIRDMGVNMIEQSSKPFGRVVYMVTFDGHYVDYDVHLMWTYIYQNSRGTGNSLKEAISNYGINS